MEKRKETPILFSAPIVRAILDDRKSQTRCIMKPQPIQNEHGWWSWCGINKGQNRIFSSEHTSDESWVIDKYCPYGRPGDLLWVKEPYLQWKYCDGEKGEIVYYDDPNIQYILRDKESFSKLKNVGNWRIMSSRFMPRAASRLTLEVKDVKVERLQNITSMDAMREGVYFSKRLGGYVTDEEGRNFHAIDPRKSFFQIWIAINGSESFDENPFVFAVSFKKV